VGDVGELDLPVPAELPADRFHHPTVNGPKTFHIGLNVYAFTALMFLLGICWPSARPVSSSTSATTTPKHRRHQRHRGPGRWLGGFVLPIMFGA
jgi:NNP family nitrate/nitrite transporter-like MFS transporter